MKIKRILVLLTVFSMVFGIIPALPVMAEEVSASITASEDSYTEASNPDKAVGAINTSTIITSSTGGKKPAADNRDVYLKFDFRSHDLSALISAKLRLFINSVANKADRDLTIYAVSSDWSEKTITYNNAPQLIDETPIAVYTQVYDKNNHADIWVSIDLTDYIKEHYSEGIISLKISSDTGATKMDSRDTTNVPAIDVLFDSSVETAGVTVSFVDELNSPIARDVSLSGIAVGSYAYPHDIPSVVSYLGTDYEYDPAASITSIDITPEGENRILLVYRDPIKTPEGVSRTVVPVSEDTFAKQNDTDTIFNTEDPGNLQVTMNMGEYGAAARRDGFIKFDLSGVERTFITSARLVGYVISATNEGSRIISVYPTENANWSESTLNWNNAPAYDDTNLVAQYTVQSGTTGAWVSADITEYCRSAGDILSFRMISDTAATSFATKDADPFNAMAIELRYTNDSDYNLADVTVNVVDTDGETIAPSFTVRDCLVGDYYYGRTPDPVIDNENGVFLFERELSTLHINVTSDGPNEIVLVYHKEGANMGTSVLATSGGWNWCLDPRAVRDIDKETGSDKTYVAYIDNEGNIKATQYDNVANTYKQVYVRKGFTADDHSNPAVFVLPNHRVMIIYSAHTSEDCFYYRISSLPNDISSFGEEKTVSTQGYDTVTYPTPYYMSDAPDSFFLFWRGISWQPTMARFSLPDENDDITFEMKPTITVDSRLSESETDKRPYAKYASNGKDRIYISYTYAHPDTASPNTLYCSYLDINDMTLHDVTGEMLANIAEAPFKVTNTEDTADALVVNRADDVRNWNWETELDENGNPVVLFVGISDDSETHLYYHSRWTGEEWLTTYIDNGGRWFHDNTKGAEKCYSGGLCMDHSDTNIVFASIPVEGIYGTYYEIYKYVLNGQGGVISKTPVTQNSSENNFRPYVVMNADPNDPVYLVWLSGEYYYWSNKKDFLPSNGNVKYGFTNKVNTASVLSGYDWTDDLTSIDLGDTDNVVSDLAFVSSTVNGASVSWKSSDTGVVRDDGAVIRPAQPTQVTVTATLTLANQTCEKDFVLTVNPKTSTEENLVFRYDFEAGDLYEGDGQTMIVDKSPNGNDARLMGTVGQIEDGVLNLTGNLRDASNGNRPMSSNSYLIAPDYLLNSLRSYSFVGRVKLNDVSMDYRLYDFGSGGTNSVFGRLCSSFQAGIKINDGTTQYVSADEKLVAGQWYDVAYTYDAFSGLTKIYLNGVVVASGKTIETEAIELLGENTRNYIGRSQWWDTYYDYTARENPDFNGWIDSIALYNAALTDDEIKALAQENEVEGALEIDSVTSQGASVLAKVTNSSHRDENCVLFVRTADGGTFEVKSSAFRLAAGESRDIEVTFADEIGGKSVKAFIWEEGSLRPLCGAYTVE